MGKRGEASAIHLQPAFPGRPAALLFSANNAFVPCLAAMLHSVLRNAAPASRYDLVILHRDISPENRELLAGMAGGRANVSLRFQDLSRLGERYRFYTKIHGGRLTQEAYFRLFAPMVLSPAYQKAVYLDADMAALTDVSPLLQMDLGESLLAAPRDLLGIGCCHVPGSPLLRYRRRALGLENPDDYFISSVLVMNLTLFRSLFPGDSLLRLAASRPWRQHDQDVLNLAGKGRTLLLDASWSVTRGYGSAFFLPPARKEEWRRSLQRPRILHYGGSGKPWLRDVAQQEAFWENAARTPFFSQILAGLQGGRFPPQAQAEELRAALVSGRLPPCRRAVVRALKGGAPGFP